MTGGGVLFHCKDIRFFGNVGKNYKNDLDNTKQLKQIKEMCLMTIGFAGGHCVTSMHTIVCV